MSTFKHVATGLTLVALVLCLLPATSASAGQDIAPRFASYYQQHQGLRLLGYPVSGVSYAYGYPVQYFEKTRIEDHRGESANPEWAFAYGRLAAEMMESSSADNISVSQTNLTYANLHAASAPALRKLPPAGFKSGTVRVSTSGDMFVPFDSALAAAPGYVVPAIFWNYINREEYFPGGWLHDVGLPMTGELPATVVKNGETRQITLQAFERTVLSYDPKNPANFQVERANIGADALAGMSDIGVAAVGQVAIPREGAVVTLPLHIMAWLHDQYQVVEARLQWRDGTLLSGDLPVIWQGDSGLAIGSIDWLMEGPPPEPTTNIADLTIHPKGSEMVLVRQENLTVLPFDDRGTMQIQVYWTSEETVQPITQVIPRTQAVGRAAIEELLWGPGPRAIAFPGFSTALPTPEQIAQYPGKQLDWGPRVTLRSLNIANGVATADFSKEINAYGGGSLRVSLIAKQITSTLKQFPTIHEVRIAVEGETEAVLQP